MALINMHELITEAIDGNRYSIGIFLDLAKAFDTIDHSILIKKLYVYGIRGLPLQWFKNYLSERYQQVQCNGTLSQLKLVKYGVHQGSNLGPLLFLLYINDLPNATDNLKLILFADDTNVFCSHSSWTELKDMVNVELNKIAEWFKSNRLSLNVKKSCFISFHSSKSNLQNLNQK